MTEIYCIGPNSIYEEEEVRKDERFVWFVYHYEDGGYDGSGEAVALGKDGQLYSWNLSHCSCYGPLESFGGAQVPIKESIEEFLKPKESIFDHDCMEAVKTKVKELLANYTAPLGPVFDQKMNLLEGIE